MYFSAMYIDCVDIARRSSARGRQTTVRWQKQVFVHTRLSRAYLALGFLVIYNILGPYMDFVIYRYRLHLQKAQHVVIDSNLLSLAAVVMFGNIF